MIPNRYETPCSVCARPVPRGDGVLQATGTGSRVVCLDHSGADLASTIVEVERRLAAWKGGKLGDYQRVGAAWLHDRIAAGRGALLGDDQGLGKTLQGIAAIPADASVGVICPSVALGVWREHFERLRPSFTSQLWPRDPVAGCFAPNTVSLSTYRKIPEVYATLGEAAVPDVLLIDEAHYLGNEQTQRTRKARGLGKRIARRGGSVVALTGTPIRNNPGELRSILVVCGLLRETPWVSTQAFRRDWGGTFGKYGVEWEGERAATVPGVLRSIMLRREKRDVLQQLPPTREETIVVGISREARRVCEKALKALSAAGVSLDDAMADAGRTKSKGARFEELSAACSALATAKVPATIELLEAAGPGKLVWSRHVAPLRAVRESLGERWGIIVGGVTEAERERQVAAFQAGELDGLCLSIGAAATALTLTRSDHSIFLDEAWTPADNSQARARNHRIGQDRPVLYTRLVADHKLDRRLAEINEEKARLFNETISAARVGKAAS